MVFVLFTASMYLAPKIPSACSSIFSKSSAVGAKKDKQMNKVRETKQHPLELSTQSNLVSMWFKLSPGILLGPSPLAVGVVVALALALPLALGLGSVSA